MGVIQKYDIELRFRQDVLESKYRPILSRALVSYHALTEIDP